MTWLLTAVGLDDPDGSALQISNMVRDSIKPDVTMFLIEAYGTGLRKIMDVYEAFSGKPVISVTKNSFKITLPNVNAGYTGGTASASAGGVTSSSAQELDDKEQQVLNYVREHGAITRPETEKLLGVSASTASRLLKKMVRSNRLSRQGKARNVRYVSTN